MAFRDVLVHVFVGSKEGRYNVIPFQKALESVAKEFAEFNVTIVYYSIKDIKDLRMSMENFAQWLALAQIYFIISHPGQGFSMYQGTGEDNWPPWRLADQSKVLTMYLRGRIGFPDAFDCGAFSQNKLAYKEALKDICIPYHLLTRTVDGELCPEERRKLFRFYLISCFILMYKYNISLL